jgi:hypothetical protein
VEDVAAYIVAFQREFTVDDSLKIPSTLKLDLSALETEYLPKSIFANTSPSRSWQCKLTYKRYDVRLILNKQTGKLQVLGAKDSIAQVLEDVNSKINNSSTFAQVCSGISAASFNSTILTGEICKGTLSFRTRFCSF